MTVLHLPLRISRADAAQHFWRVRFANLYGLLRARPMKQLPGGVPDSLELVWMPAYAVRLTLSKGTSRSDAWVSVDASFGGFALFEREGILEEGVLDEECFPAIIGEEEAESLARQGLLKYVLRRRGVKPLIEGVEEVFFYYQPVWVYYYYRSGTKIDLAVSDGYTGSPMGTQLRIAIVNALIQNRKEAAEARSL
ncbi:MAG: hypothetical protein KAH38_02160 [Candidatus Hydrogenedentes bacterium]|nr:hypothetical protein [Candidatus Hydrogenedentota bacterium]